MTSSATASFKAPAVAAAAKPSLTRDSILTASFTDIGVISFANCEVVVGHAASLPATLGDLDTTAAINLTQFDAVTILPNDDGSTINKLSVVGTVYAAWLAGLAVGDPLWVCFFANAPSGGTAPTCVAGPFLAAA